MSLDMDIGLAVTESGKSVTVFLNGNFTDGKEIILSPLWTTDDFLQAAARRLGMAKATRMFTPDGHEVDDILYLEEKEILFLSSGEPWKQPEEVGPYIGGYVVGRMLGRGGFGEVRIGTHIITKEVTALKFMSKDSMGSASAAERVATEIHCLTALDHPGVIKMHRVLNQIDFVVLVFEYASGGDLFQYVTGRKEGRLTEKESRHIFSQILSAVAYAHNHHICHGDLKLENILLTTKVVQTKKVPSIHDSGNMAFAAARTLAAEEKKRRNSALDDSFDGIDIVGRQPLVGEDEPASPLPPAGEVGEGTTASGATSSAGVDGDNIGKNVEPAANAAGGGDGGDASQEYLNVQVKVADFGLSMFYRPGEKSHAVGGSTSYMAPEVWNNEEIDGPALDVWCLGCILFAMLCGRLPFDDGTLSEFKIPSDEEMTSRTNALRYDFSVRSLSVEAKNCVARQLRLLKGQRASIPDLYNHPWMTHRRDSDVVTAQALQRELRVVAQEAGAGSPDKDTLEQMELLDGGDMKPSYLTSALSMVNSDRALASTTTAAASSESRAGGDTPTLPPITGDGSGETKDDKGSERETAAANVAKLIQSATMGGSTQQRGTVLKGIARKRSMRRGNELTVQTHGISKKTPARVTRIQSQVSPQKKPIKVSQTSSPTTVGAPKPPSGTPKRRAFKSGSRSMRKTLRSKGRPTL